MTALFVCNYTVSRQSLIKGVRPNPSSLVFLTHTPTLSSHPHQQMVWLCRSRCRCQISPELICHLMNMICSSFKKTTLQFVSGFYTVIRCHTDRYSTKSVHITFQSHNDWIFKVIQALSVVIWKASDEISSVWPCSPISLHLLFSSSIWNNDIWGVE